MIKFIKTQKGLTLVEVIASIVLLSIVLIGFSSFFIQSAKYTKFNQETLTSVEVAEDVVSKVRRGEYKNKNINDIIIENGYPGYDVTVKIMEGPSQSRLKKALITVTSTSVNGIKNNPFSTEMYFEGEI